MGNLANFIDHVENGVRTEYKADTWDHLTKANEELIYINTHTHTHAYIDRYKQGDLTSDLFAEQSHRAIFQKYH